MTHELPTARNDQDCASLPNDFGSGIPELPAGPTSPMETVHSEIHQTLQTGYHTVGNKCQKNSTHHFSPEMLPASLSYSSTLRLSLVKTSICSSWFLLIKGGNVYFTNIPLNASMKRKRTRPLQACPHVHGWLQHHRKKGQEQM